MLNIRTGITAMAFIVASSVAFAQTPATPAKPAPAAKQETMKSTTTTTTTTTSSPTSTSDEVKNWTTKKWNSMKAEWQKDKAKWNACDAQSKAKHLTGKASWSFFYDCMKA
jgi:hypothetical protein